MRIILITACILSCFAASAQRVIRKGTAPTVQAGTPAPDRPRYKFEQFQGRWQEVERKDEAGKKLDFSDTLLLKFHGNKVESKDATSMRITMDYEYDILAPDILLIGTDEHQIISLSPEQMVLKDEHSQKMFKKMDVFYYETVGKDSIISEELSIPVHTNTRFLKGKWEVYRTKANPGSTGPQTILIKRLEFNSIGDTVSARGAVTFNLQGSAVYEPADFNFGGTSIGIKTKTQTLSYDIFKAGEREIIFGENTALLFYVRKVTD